MRKELATEKFSSSPDFFARLISLLSRREFQQLTPAISGRRNCSILPLSLPRRDNVENSFISPVAAEAMENGDLDRRCIGYGQKTQMAKSIL